MQATLRPKSERGNRHATGHTTGHTDRPASEKQLRFIEALRRDRDDTGMGPTPDDLSMTRARAAIDWLLKRPYRQTERPEYEPGYYRQIDTSYLVYVKVKRSKSSGRLYGTVCTLTGPDAIEDGAPIKWQYAPGILRRELEPISAADAAQFGHSTAVCIYCAQRLTDERSVAVGYGPVCAANNGLPWGETETD